MKTRLSEKEKGQLIKHFQSGVSVSTISSDSGVPKSTIYSWIKSYEENSSLLGFPISQKEYNALMRRAARLKDMVDILKSVDCTVSSPLQEKLNAIESLHGEYSVHMLCDALEVAGGTYYNHIFRNKRTNTTYAENRRELSILIRDIFDENHQLFGTNKIRAILVDRGYAVSDKTVAELMREMGLYSVSKTAKKDYTKWRKSENKNILQQNFKVDQPNQVWLSDVTVFKYREKYIYICVIIDLYSRKIIAYNISGRNSTQLITKTFRDACSLRQPGEGLIFHSDRGAPYVSFAFQRLLRELSVTQSLSRSGRPHDNAVSESFFSYLKREELYRRNYMSEKDLIRGIDTYISFYNEKRPHSSLQYKTPEKMEEIAFNKQN